MDDSMAAVSALDRMLEPLAHSLNVDAAKAIIALQVDESVQDRMEALADRCNEGLLTAAERAEYDGYVEGAEILLLLKLKAHRYLDGRDAA